MRCSLQHPNKSIHLISREYELHHRSKHQVLFRQLQSQGSWENGCAPERFRCVSAVTTNFDRSGFDCWQGEIFDRFYTSVESHGQNLSFVGFSGNISDHWESRGTSMPAHQHRIRPTFLLPLHEKHDREQRQKPSPVRLALSLVTFISVRTRLLLLIVAHFVNPRHFLREPEAGCCAA